MTWWLRVNSYSGDEGYLTREIPVRGTQAQVEKIADRINKTRNHYNAEAFEYPDVYTLGAVRLWVPLAFEPALRVAHNNCRQDSKACRRCDRNTASPKRDARAGA